MRGSSESALHSGGEEAGSEDPVTQLSPRPLGRPPHPALSPRRNGRERVRTFFSLFFLLCTCLAAAETITVAAAASLTDALADLSQRYERAHPGVKVRLTFAGSGVLQRQIELGAPIDLFLSASMKEATQLVASRAVKSEDVVSLVSNQLVLVAPKSTKLRSWADLRSVRRLALPNPATVPSGRYGKQTLERRGLWTLVQSKLITAQNVRQALAYAVSGDVDAAIVFATDAKISPSVQIVDRAIGVKDHDPIVYPAAVVSASRHRRLTLDFLRFLRDKDAQGTFRAHGFLPISGRSATIKAWRP